MVFGIKVIASRPKHLGLLLSLSKNKKDIFAHIVTWVSEVVLRWKDRLILTASKKIPIKSWHRLYQHIQ